LAAKLDKMTGRAASLTRRRSISQTIFLRFSLSSSLDAHARVAIGLDYLGAAPVRGTRYGGGMETLSVAVKVDQAGGRQGQSQSQS
jgi:hypothetical protein